MTIANLVQFALVVTVILSTLIWIISFSSPKQDFQRRLIAIHFFSISIWALSTIIILLKENMLAVQLGFASAVILAISKYYFILYFPTRLKQRSFLFWLPLGISTLLFITSFFNDFYVSDFQVVDSAYIIIENGQYAGLYAAIITWLLLYPIFHLYKKMRLDTYSQRIREQVKFLFLGISVFFVLGLLTNSILPIVFNIHHFNGLGPSLSLILAGFIVYIISHYNFLNISVVIQRSFIYTTIAGTIIGSYLLLLFTLNEIFTPSSHLNPAASGLITTIIGVLSARRIADYLRKKTDPLFFKDNYNYSDTLEEACELLNHDIDIENIKQHTTAVLTKNLKVEEVKYDILDDHAPARPGLSKLSVNTSGEITVPLISNERLIGRLLIGEKRSGDPFNQADKQLLQTLSYSLATAIERALLHKQLQDYARQLEQKVKDRTAELEQAYQSQRDIVSNIAHGLQTPITIIENELSNQRSLSKTSDSLQTLQNSLASMSRFIHDLLRLTHLEAKADNYLKKDFNLSELVKEISTYVGVLADSHDAEINTKIESDVVIFGDQKKIEEAIISLLSNALKYKKPGVRQKITLGIKSNNNIVYIFVSDTGLGIPPEDLPMIFNRLFRVTTSDRKDIPGSGLGLAIAKTIVVDHGGSITVDSTYGETTTFIITLPQKTKV